MADKKQLEFFTLRYVPDAVKDEAVNIGVLLVETGANGAGFAGVRVTADWSRVRCLDPDADIEWLQALEADLRGRLAGDRARLLEKLQDALSNSLQLSPPKACLAEDPQEEMARLAEMYLEAPRRAGKRGVTARQAIHHRMRDAFTAAGVWELMHKRIAAAEYGLKGDPLRIDCGYRPNGVMKMFHAVALTADVDAAKVLAFSFPLLAAGMREKLGIKSELTAITEDALDRGNEAVTFAVAALEQARIAVARESDLPRLAQAARAELKI